MAEATLSIEVTPREKNDIVQALRTVANEEEASGAPGEADRLRGIASRIERG